MLSLTPNLTPKGRALFAGLITMLVNAPGCAPNRAQWMQRAAEQQAKAATESIGDVERVRTAARQAGDLLETLAMGVLRDPPPGKPEGPPLSGTPDKFVPV